MPSRIFHYTDIESLALILKTKKLRFTRLDRVDDIREAQEHSGINFGKYFFVSCWTQQEIESIPQWNMYSREMQGVRIDLPEYPFLNQPLRTKPGWGGIECNGELLSPMAFEDLFGDSYFIVPTSLNRDHFAGPVEYVPDVEELYIRSIHREVATTGHVNLNINELYKLPRYKTQDWEFQKEYRFSLFAMPSLPVPKEGSVSKTFFENINEYMSNAFINNIDTSINYIDIPINPLVFEELVVRTGPLCTPGGRACAESLLSHHAPSARLEVSALTGSIRSKG